MKLIWIPLISLFATFAFAASEPSVGTVILKVPLFVQGIDEGILSMAEVNRRLGPNDPPQMESFQVTRPGDYRKLMQYLDVTFALTPFKGAMVASENFPGELRKDGLATCFIGDALAIPGLVDSLKSGTGPYSDQLIVVGWKYKRATAFTGNSYDYLCDHSDLWKNFNPNSEGLLLLTSFSANGADIHESMILPCK